MALSLSANSYNRQAWENSDFPILCETCLGDNPYVRMMKEKYGSECKICERPFTTYRWCPGKGMRYKKTEICQTCCRLKNVCQTCLLDLEYGLPVQVRDSALQIQDNVPKSAVNKEYFNQVAEKEMSLDPTKAFGQLGKLPSTQNEMLTKLSRKSPYYRRNRPHVCSFWVKGECKRGEECPYRHEMPNDPEDPLTNQNIKDRFYGVNDPVADKLVNRYHELHKEEKIEKNKAPHPDDAYESSSHSHTTPGLPPVLPAPPTEISNDFFGLSSFTSMIPPPPPPPPSTSKGSKFVKK